MTETSAESRKWAWHIHHDVLVERLTEPIESRRDCIRHNKPKEEIELRLRLLRRVGRQEVLDAYEATKRTAWEAYEATKRTAWEAVERLHEQECPGCPWNGKTIFGVRP